RTPEVTCAHTAFDLDVRGEKSEDEPGCQNSTARLGRREDRVGALTREGDGLFKQDVLPRRKGPFARLAVEGRRQAHVDGHDAGILEGSQEIRGRLRAHALGHAGGLLSRSRGDPAHPCARAERFPPGGVCVAHKTCAENGHLDHATSLTTDRGCEGARTTGAWPR